MKNATKVILTGLFLCLTFITTNAQSNGNGNGNNNGNGNGPNYHAANAPGQSNGGVTVTGVVTMIQGQIKIIDAQGLQFTPLNGAPMYQQGLIQIGDVVWGRRVGGNSGGVGEVTIIII
jgi:hypothetical protein